MNWPMFVVALDPSECMKLREALELVNSPIQILLTSDELHEAKRNKIMAVKMLRQRFFEEGQELGLFPALRAVERALVESYRR